MKIEKESDALKREYRRLAHMLGRLTRKYPYDKIEHAVNQIFQREHQIIKELEECTGIEITAKTELDIILEDLGDQKALDDELREKWAKTNEELYEKIEAKRQAAKEMRAAEEKARIAEFRVPQDRENKEGNGLDPWLS